MSHQLNINRIKTVYNALEEIATEVIFVGGATVSLYADRPSPEIRPTEDIDILLEIQQYSAYAQIEERLKKKGFKNDIESGVICRYIIKEVVVDVMPTSSKVLGFSNKWYPEAFANSSEIIVDENYTIRIFSPIYFIATKLEAWKGRGKNDGRTSTDFEDIVFILNNRNVIWQELDCSPKNLKKYIKDEFIKLLSQPYIHEWINCHLDFHEQRRTVLIIERMNDFVNKN